MGRRYQNPPVVEALCELFFVGSIWDTTVPGQLYERVRDRFPKKGEVNEVGVELQVAPGGTGARMLHGNPRTQFIREDGSRMVQLARDLLVVNEVRPYTRFEDWRPLVAEMLDAYRQVAQPSGLMRLGVRYINRVVISTIAVKLDDYFRVYPQLPSEVATAHGPFVMRVELPMSSSNTAHRLIVTFGSAPNDEARSSAFLLDLYDIVELDGSAAFDQVPTLLDEAHANIEKTFENAITAEARRLFREVT